MKKAILLYCLLSPFVIFGQETPVAESLKSAQELLRQRKAEEALDVLTRLQKESSKLSAQDNMAIKSLLGQSYTRLAQYDKAASSYEWLLGKAAGNDSLMAVCQSELAKMGYYMSDYNKGITHANEARELYRKLYGVDDKRYTGNLNTLGNLYYNQGKYRDAENTFIEAKQINYRLTGGENIQYARIVNSLAKVYAQQNRYAQAYELFQTSLRIKEQLSGKESLDYAKTLYNLVDFQFNLGQYAKAVSTLEEVIRMYTLNKLTEHPEFLKLLDFKAILTEKTGDIAGARKLYEESLIRRETSGDTKEDYSFTLLNLGNLLEHQNQSKQAQPYVEKALDLIAKIHGVDHPNYAEVITTLANIQHTLGMDEKAKANYEKAVKIVKNAYGKDHIYYFQAQFAYARFLRQTGEKNKAIEIYKSIYKMPPAYLKRVSSFISEKDLNDRIEEFRSFTLEVYSFIRENPDNHDLRVIAYNSTLYFRSFILVNLQKFRQFINKSRSVVSTFDNFIDLQQQLEEMLKKPLKERGNTAKLEKEIMELQVEMNQAMGSINTDDSKVRWKDVRRSLAPNEVAVEYIAFPDPYAADSMYYGALYLTANAEEPGFIPLCRESDFSFLLPASGPMQGKYNDRIYEGGARGVVPTGQKEVSIASLIWEPLSTQFPGLKRAYVVPDGLLNQIALSALPITFDSVIADKVEMVYESSTWQVVPNDKTIFAYSGNKAMVIGGVDYGPEPPPAMASRAEGGDDIRYWRPLPYAKVESQSVSKILKEAKYEVVMLDGQKARESTVVDSLENAEAGYRVIYMATHGFFAPKSASDNMPAAGFYGNGLLNSGLVLSGANEAGPLASASEDGILTAFEISRLNLSHTELVVLSACETALGDIKFEEGVFGLQRAFKLSGAGKLIMSLWEVDDKKTKIFMETFYKNWLSGHDSIREAFSKTQKELRDGAMDPDGWAAFILLE
ncbi:MAG: tetratricopeptide repeat protein [Lewinellaceae bacterium]|nr:tetratricopeptide repeat protein [Saprospiraceae bacterium]MCB9344377.1 tetratricopeptide repeat protein [Lewinellaceae bacterium]